MAAGGGGDHHRGGGGDGMMVERVLVLVEPAKEKRRPDDRLPEEILLDRPSIVIGRSVKADVQLFLGEGTQNTISRKHAQLRVEGDGVVKLEDLGALNGLFVNRVKVLTAKLQPNDLVQFGGAAGLKAGETLAPPPSPAGAGGAGGAVGAEAPSAGVGSSGNAIVYRFVVRPKEQQPQGQGQGAAAGKKRPAAVNGHAPAMAAVEAAATADDDAAASSDAKRRRVVQEEGAQGEGNGNGAARGATTRLEEEVKELRAALAGATQGAEAIFKALGMAPGAGLGQAAKAVERAMAALAKAEGEKAGGKQGAKQEAAELRKWKEKAESLTLQLKARDAELLAAEAKADALEETGAQAANRAQALEGEKSTMGSQLAGVEKEKAALQAQLDEVTAHRRSLQEELGKAHTLAAAATAASTNPSTSSSGSSSASKEAVLMKEVRPELSCAVCAGLLMDAAVLPCSHAFCFACLHPKLSEAKESKAKKGGGGGACPICREAIPPGARPYRSTHLDTVVAIVVEALPAQERGEWETREAATRAYYDKHGGEQRVCYGEKSEEEEGEDEEEMLGADAMGAGASVISPTQKPAGRAGAGAGKWKKGEAMCEGCNERGHDYEDCPHRKGGGFGGGEDEEEDEDGGYGDEDEEEEEEGEGDDDGDDSSSGRVGW